MNGLWMRRLVARVTPVFALFSVAGVGCPPSGDPNGETVSFAADVQPIFDAFCIDCHVPGGFADLQGISLRLSAGDSYDQLVNQPSEQNATWTLVVPGNADASLLFVKVHDEVPPFGSRMPLFADPLDAASIDLIREWIVQGAIDN